MDIDSMCFPRHSLPVPRYDRGQGRLIRGYRPWGDCPAVPPRCLNVIWDNIRWYAKLKIPLTICYNGWNKLTFSYIASSSQKKKQFSQRKGENTWTWINVIIAMGEDIEWTRADVFPLLKWRRHNTCQVNSQHLTYHDKSQYQLNIVDQLYTFLGPAWCKEAGSLAAPQTVNVFRVWKQHSCAAKLGKDETPAAWQEIAAKEMDLR